MSARTPQPFDARRLDVARFTLEAKTLEGAVPLEKLPRLLEETATQAITADAPVVIDWQAQGEMRRATRQDMEPDDGTMHPALHLRVQGRLPLVCQRCLQALWTEVVVDRHFLFAPDEAQAVRLDEHVQDDVLALAEDFDLLGLIEDELLLALPFAPHHRQCQQALPVRNTRLDGAVLSQPHSFALLAKLKKQKPDPDNL